MENAQPEGCPVFSNINSAVPLLMRSFTNAAIWFSLRRSRAFDLKADPNSRPIQFPKAKIRWAIYPRRFLAHSLRFRNIA
ncbi:MAG: hypothetical protein IPH79_00065 [Sphingomonadales bacterium]|nr:hypothetical protein [Sphingomonadales bacterium]